ncbi:MAG: hypothetical protein ACP5NV_02590 [Candidatus Woesearchaeota archaeon]
MNKKAEVEGFMPMVLVKLIFAVVLILLVTLLLVMLWNALFGNDNKTEKDNFETLFKLIESKQKSIDEYDSARLTIYLETGYLLTSSHTIFFFSDDDRIECKDSKPIYRPSDCKTGTSCLCLYDSDPDRGADEKDEDVIMCKNFNSLFKIEKNDFQIINFEDECDRNFDGDYANLIVGVHNTDQKKRVFVWKDTPENRKLDEQFKKNRCPETTGLCKDRRDSEVIYNFEEVNKECTLKDSTKAYFEAKCVLENGKCNAECQGIPCSELSCEKRNVDEDFYVKNSKEEYFCNNKICGETCNNYIIQQYSCINGKEKECKELLDETTIPGFIGNCSVIIGEYSEFNTAKKNYDDLKLYQLGDIVGFDDSKNTISINCKSTIEQHFKKYPILVCIPGIDCNGFVIKNPEPIKEIKDMISNCEVTAMRAGGKIFITEHNSCTDLSNYFTQAHRCYIGTFVGGGGTFGGSGAGGNW